jgi:hypothetical protein
MRELRVDSAQDVAVQAIRLCRAVVGQVHRSRGASSGDVALIAVDAWEKIATRDYVLELATRTIPGATPTDVVERLGRDAEIYLTDCSQMDPMAGRAIGAARGILASAINAVLRHA